MFAGALFPSGSDGEVAWPRVDLFDGRADSLPGGASFSVDFDLGAPEESPSLPHVTLTFILGSPDPFGSAICADTRSVHGRFGVTIGELEARKASLSRSTGATRTALVEERIAANPISGAVLPQPVLRPYKLNPSRAWSSVETRIHATIRGFRAAAS